VWKKDWDKYIGGDLLQNVWGHYDPDEREILRGARAGHYFCPPCFDLIHSEGLDDHYQWSEEDEADARLAENKEEGLPLWYR
jgi:hypothetical protein